MLKTLNQAIIILLLFREKSSWGTREIAKKLNVNHSSVYRIVKTFEANRFLVKSKMTNKYELGIPVWELGVSMYKNLYVTEIIRPHLEKLMEKTGESVFLTGLDGKEGITIDAVEPENRVKFTISLGSRDPLYVGATFLVILAHLSEEVRDEVLAGPLIQHTPYTMTDKNQIMGVLEKIKKQGWWMSEGEYTPDVIAIAVPLFSEQDNIIGSLTVSGPTYRISKEKEKILLEELRKTEKKISKAIKTYHLDFSLYLQNQ